MKLTLLPLVFLLLTLFACRHFNNTPQNNSDVTIYNGKLVPQEHWATNVAVQVIANGSCSGVVVGPKAIMTASHCFLNKDKKSAGRTNIEIAFNVKDSTNPNGILTFKASWWNFNEVEPGPMDIALIELEDMPSFAEPAYIADSHWPLEDAWIYGWGSYSKNNEWVPENGVMSLRETRLSCRRTTNNVPEIKICKPNWDQTPDAQARRGDSGSGLLAIDPSTNKRYVTGVVITARNELNLSYAIEVSKVRDVIKKLNTNCRLQINNLPCP